jgi:hypothetical protein
MDKNILVQNQKFGKKSSKKRGKFILKLFSLLKTYRYMLFCNTLVSVMRCMLLLEKNLIV